MAIQNGFFKSINGDRRYLAEFFTSYFASFIGNGVFPNPSTNLQVINNQNFSTIVRPGKGWINGHYLNNDDSIVINHQPPDGVLRRIDRIVFSVNLDSRSMDIYLKQGTPSSSAVAPTLIRNSTLYELALADIAFNPGMVSISQSNITDQRMNKALCGIVHGVVEQLDTTTLFNQYQQFLVEKGVEFDQQLAVNQQTFDDWFAQLNDILDGDVAANLANMIVTHANNATPQKHIEVVDAIPQNLANKGLLLVVDDVDDPYNPPEIPTSIVLSGRIDDVNQQLAQKANESAVTQLAQTKADKTYVDNITQSLASGSPKGTYPTLSALNNAIPNGNNNIYVVNSDGKWYYWNGNAWTAGGQYQSDGIADNSIGIPKFDDEVKKLLVYNFSDWVLGTISAATGRDAVSNTALRTTGIYRINSGDRLAIPAFEYYINIYLYSLDGVYIERISWNLGEYIFTDNYLVRVTLNHRLGNDLSNSDIGLLGTYTEAYFFKNKPVNFGDVTGSLDGSRVVNDSILTTKVKKLALEANLVTNGLVNVSFFGNRAITFHGTETYMYYGDRQLVITQSSVPVLANARQRLIYDFNDNLLKCIPTGSGNQNYNLSQDQLALGILRLDGHVNINCNNVVVADEPYLGSYKVKDNGILKQYLIDELDVVMGRASIVEGDFKFAFSTDMHVRNSALDYYKLQILSEAGKYGTVNFVVCGGDVVDGFESHQDIMYKLTKSMKNLKRNGVVDTFIAQGNHDTHFVYFHSQEYGPITKDNALTPNKWHNLACKHLEGKVTFDPDNPYGGYFYKDYDDSKIRVIMMNTSDTFVTDGNGVPTLDTNSQYVMQKQLNWLYRDALNFMDKGSERTDWQVVTISHNNLASTKFGKIALNIIDAYIKGIYLDVSENDTATGISVFVTCDFTQQGPMDFICCINGHTHYDYILLEPLINRPVINVVNSSTTRKASVPEGAQVYDRVAGTLSAEALDVVTINKIERLITLNRFGVGADRQVNY